MRAAGANVMKRTNSLALPYVRGQRGSAALYVAATLVTLLGMVGLGTEVGDWYLAKRHGQNTADAAALAGMMALVANGETCADPLGVIIATNAATYQAQQNGLTSGLTVRCPPNRAHTRATKAPLRCS